jgi:exodeoxyribonuclease VII small subunit
MPKKNTVFDFERSMREIEALVDKMEAGDLSLEESLKQFERGVQLTRACQKALSEAEQKVQILLGKEGKPRLDPFESESEKQATEEAGPGRD